MPHGVDKFTIYPIFKKRKQETYDVKDMMFAETYGNFKRHNEGKNIFSSARTPAVLFSVMTIAYFMSGFFGILGMESFASLMNWVLGIFLILLKVSAISFSNCSLYVILNSTPPIFLVASNKSMATVRHRMCSLSSCSGCKYGFSPPHTYI
jgi:hypothetical protein